MACNPSKVVSDTDLFDPQAHYCISSDAVQSLYAGAYLGFRNAEMIDGNGFTHIVRTIYISLIQMNGQTDIFSLQLRSSGRRPEYG